MAALAVVEDLEVLEQGRAGGEVGRERRRASSPHSRVAKKLSAMALS